MLTHEYMGRSFQVDQEDACEIRVTDGINTVIITVEQELIANLQSLGTRW